MEDVFANILVVILAARFLYDSSKQNETIVGVVPMATGLECGVPRTVKLDVVLKCAELQAMREVYSRVRRSLAGPCGKA